MEKQESRLGKILGYTGAGVAVVYGIAYEAPFFSALLAFALLAIGNILGEKIDMIIQGKMKGKSIVKLFLSTIIMILIALIVFKGCSYKEKPNLKPCPNCGTMMEPQYIYPGGCNRCDGKDWD